MKNLVMQNIVFVCACYLSLAFVISDIAWITTLYDGEDDHWQRFGVLFFVVAVGVNMFIDFDMQRKRRNP